MELKFMNSSLKFLSVLFFTLCLSVFPKAKAAESYPSDDVHNHDGTHSDGPKNCGGNYMFPGGIARLGSHSFMILGQEDENHILAEHRSGTPPHNYQFVLRIRLDADEMALYKKILKESKTLPAFTTIYFNAKGEQVDRTFFCLQDLPKIFGEGHRKGDEFEKLFPIRASLQKNADHEGSFDIKPSVVPGAFLSIDQSDVEIVVYRYLPGYLEQSSFRQIIKERPKEIVPLLGHSPLYANEPVETASKHSSYRLTDAKIVKEGEFCPKDYYLPKVANPKTIHTFLLMTEVGPNTVLAIHYYDAAPQNFQTVLKLKLSDEEVNIYRLAKKDSKVPPLFQTRTVGKTESESIYFCMADLKQLVRSGKFLMKGTVYKNSDLNDYRLGTPVGTLDLASSDIEVLMNRTLNSFMDPEAVAKDVLGKR